MSEKKVFISYSSKDFLYAKGIAAMLKEIGVSYWKAPEMIPAGSNYAREIPVAIRECDVFLLLVSASSQKSMWVEKELDSALNNRKEILPIKLDNEPLDDLFKFYLNNIQMISYDMEKDELLELLKLELKGEVSTIVKEEQSIPNEASQKEFVKRQNGLTVNKAPVECKFCKGAIREESRGVYVCLSCGKKSYDYYQTVKRYLERHGAASAWTIEKATGVPRKAIEYLLKEEYLEISSKDSYRMSCLKCGAKIRTGTLCEACKSAQRY